MIACEIFSGSNIHIFYSLIGLSSVHFRLFQYSVASWADKVGLDIWHLGDFITKRKEVQEVNCVGIQITYIL